MKKYVLFAVLFLIVACIPFTTQQKEESDILGNDGLTIKIGTLPKELFTGQGLQIPVTLENIGAAKVENGVLSISGYNEDIVKFSSPTRMEGINLEGKSTFVQKGETTTKFFTIGSINLPNEAERKEVFEVLGCYQYKTSASPVVCINPQLAFSATVVESGCNFVDAKISSTQGAPVAVSKVESWYYSDANEIEFRIFVKDVSGKGVIVDSAAYSKRCLGAESISAEEMNSVNVDVYLGGQKLTCYSNKNEQTDKFTIMDEQYAVRCRAGLDIQEPAYTTPLSVMLSYGYVTGTVFTITLKNPSIR